MQLRDLGYEMHETLLGICFSIRCLLGRDSLTYFLPISPPIIVRGRTKHKNHIIYENTSLKGTALLDSLIVLKKLMLSIIHIPIMIRKKGNKKIRDVITRLGIHNFDKGLIFLNSHPLVNPPKIAPNL